MATLSFRNPFLPPLLLAALFMPLVSAGAQSQIAIPQDPYTKWLNEDVRWIITDQESADYKKLSTDQQRDEFIIAFWERRNPIFGAAENTFKEEHYRRLAYANTHFAAGVPGYRTDRGHFYILYGTPESIDSYPTLSLPSEIWHYQRIEGVRDDIVLHFLDPCKCGVFGLVEDRSNQPSDIPK